MNEVIEKSKGNIKKMQCDFIWCIYNTDKECVLESITISSVGCCAECILPNIPKEIIDKCKERFFDKQ